MSSPQNLAVASANIISLFSISSTNEVELNYNHVSHVNSEIMDMQWNHNNMVIVCAWKNGTITLTPAKNPNSRMDDLQQGDAPIHSICMSSGSRYLTTASGSILSIWDLKTKQIIKQLKGHTSPIHKVIFNDSDRYLFSGDSDGVVLFHDANSSQVTQSFHLNTSITDIKLSPLKKNIFAASDIGGNVKIWDILSRREIFDINSSNSIACIGVDFCSKNEQLFVTASMDTTMNMWDIQSNQLVHSVNISSIAQSVNIDPVTALSSMSFLSDGKNLSIGTNNGYVMLFDIRYPDSPYHIIHASMDPIACVRFQNSNIKSKATSLPSEQVSTKATNSQIQEKTQLNNINSSLPKSNINQKSISSPLPSSIPSELQSSTQSINDQNNIKFEKESVLNREKSLNNDLKSNILLEKDGKYSKKDLNRESTQESDNSKVKNTNNDSNRPQISTDRSKLSEVAYGPIDSKLKKESSIIEDSISISKNNSLKLNNSDIEKPLSSKYTNNNNENLKSPNLNSIDQKLKTDSLKSQLSQRATSISKDVNIEEIGNARPSPRVLSQKNSLTSERNSNSKNQQPKDTKKLESQTQSNSSLHTNIKEALEDQKFQLSTPNSKNNINPEKKSPRNYLDQSKTNLQKNITSAQVDTFPNQILDHSMHISNKSQLQAPQSMSHTFQSYFDSKFQDIKQSFHKEMRSYHTELIKQFQQQQDDIEEKLESFMEQMKNLMDENTTLKQEVERLKRFQF